MGQRGNYAKCLYKTNFLRKFTFSCTRNFKTENKNYTRKKNLKKKVFTLLIAKEAMKRPTKEKEILKITTATSRKTNNFCFLYFISWHKSIFVSPLRNPFAYLPSLIAGMACFKIFPLPNINMSLLIFGTQNERNRMKGDDWKSEASHPSPPTPIWRGKVDNQIEKQIVERQTKIGQSLVIEWPSCWPSTFFV